MSAKDTIAMQRCGLSAKELNEFLSSYPIPSEYDVILPTSTQTIFDAPPGYVGLYTHSFSLANLWLPLTDFFCEGCNLTVCRSNVLFPFHKKVSRRNLICCPHVLRFKEDLGGLRSDSFMRFYQRRLMYGLKLWAYLEPIPSIYRCRNKMGQGLAHRPVIMGLSRDLRGDFLGYVPRSLFWREDLDRDGEPGFDLCSSFIEGPQRSYIVHENVVLSNVNVVEDFDVEEDFDVDDYIVNENVVLSKYNVVEEDVDVQEAIVNGNVVLSNDDVEDVLNDEHLWEEDIYNYEDVLVQSNVVEEDSVDNVLVLEDIVV
ncbi:hypothetical protein Tco_0691811 [Tanacetum coccineum]